MAKSEVPPVAQHLGIVGLLIVIFSLLYEGFGWTFLNTPQQGGIRSPESPYYEVLKVIDGDTLEVRIDGVEEKVRLIGIDAPETVDPRREAQCFGKEATNRMKELVGGKLVLLEYDDSQGMRDTYDRLLAYVYLEDGQMVNRKMVAEGYAYEYSYLTPYAYRNEFRELQTLARTSGRGLWNPEMCSGRRFFSQ